MPSLWEKPRIDIYNQVVEQVWFPGVHSNVGGSYPDTDLADLTLRWMIGRVNAHTNLWFADETYDYLLPDCGKKPDKQAVERLAAKWIGQIYDSRTGFFFFIDRYLPTLRIVCGQRPPKKGWLSRVFPMDSGEPFAQAIHWSVMERVRKWQSEGIPQYTPMNIEWALGDIQRGRIKVVSITDEIRPGQPWAGTGRARVTRSRGQAKTARRATVRVPAGPAQGQNGGQQPTP